MNTNEFDTLQKEGKVEIIEQPVIPPNLAQQQEIDMSKFDLSALLVSMKTIRKPTSVVPTVTPRTFIDQFQFYVNGTTYRLYVFIGGVWRYTTLT